MSLYLALRRARHLSTIAAAAAEPATAKFANISEAKKRLRKVYDPDEAIKVYSSFAGANDAAAPPASARHIQVLAVRRLAKSHRFSDIEAFLESLKSNPQITEEPFVSSLIKSYGVAGMIDNALTTYNQMTDFGTPRSTLSFNALLKACINSKAYDRVPLYFNEFPEKFGLVPDKFSYGMLIKAYCEMESPEKAKETLGEMEKKGAEIGAVSFSTILLALYKIGRVDEAEAFWDEMVKEKGIKLDAGSYNVKLSQIRDKPEALKAMIEEMQNAGINPDCISFNYLITSYCVNGMMDEAEKVCGDLLQAKGGRANATTFRTMVFYLCKAGRYVKAYEIFKKSVKVGKIPDFNTLKYLVTGLHKMERMVEAKAMVRTMNKKFPPDLLKAWGKLVDELGLTRVGTEEVAASKVEKGAGSDVESEK
ncbi:pentatricopeptide repeat-containing protein At4g36680, mitochondrial [Salvia miltiorrhiza]|uniref:pentatricopeptide repeat-containing protein At4g36680, mitochondrial n=1 Tax=Salvia miltiorrhiza TaxID=226208 RepID=UPI0025AB73EB|nr:pentatricopeptide repeat-containing protein At4g36680, mitochondrial [Salvia miltiorrhiza]